MSFSDIRKGYFVRFEVQSCARSRGALQRMDGSGPVAGGIADAGQPHATVVGTPARNLTGGEWLWAYFTHTAHHRGQAEVYLRLKGIRPPDYDF
jgi:hypothetical protein